MKPPCKGCPDRAMGCHGKCEEYAAFKAEREAELHARFLASEAKAATVDGFERVQRIQRSGKWRRGKE